MFKFNGRVDVTSVNARKEKHGDQRVLAIDVGIEAESVPAAVVAQLLSIPAKAFEKTFWDSKGKPNLPDFGALPITKKYKALRPGQDSEHAVTFESFDEFSDRASIIDKFKIVAIDGAKCFLTFRIAITDPSHELVCLVTDALQDSVMLTITPDNEGTDGENSVVSRPDPELPLDNPNEEDDPESPEGGEPGEDQESEDPEEVEPEEEVSPALAAAREAWDEEDKENQAQAEAEDEGNRIESQDEAQAEQDRIDEEMNGNT